MKKIEVLGVGCSKCKVLYEMVCQIVEEKNLPVEVTKITDLSVIMGYGVMQMPGLVIDGIVVSSGKNLSRQEIEKYLLLLPGMDKI